MSIIIKTFILLVVKFVLMLFEYQSTIEEILNSHRNDTPIFGCLL